MKRKARLKLGPFGGIDRRVDRTEKPGRGPSAVWEAQGVYHGEVGRLAGCYEGSESEASQEILPVAVTGVTVPRVARNAQGAYFVPAPWVGTSLSLPSLTTASYWRIDDGAYAVLAPLGHIESAPMDAVYWSTVGEWVNLGRIARLADNASPAIYERGLLRGFAATAAGTATITADASSASADCRTTKQISAECLMLIDAITSSGGRCYVRLAVDTGSPDERRYITSWSVDAAGLVTFVMNEATVKTGQVLVAIEAPGQCGAMEVDGRLVLWRDGCLARAIHPDHYDDVVFDRGRIAAGQTYSYAGDVAGAGRPLFFAGTPDYGDTFSIAAASTAVTWAGSPQKVSARVINPSTQNGAWGRGSLPRSSRIAYFNGPHGIGNGYAGETSEVAVVGAFAQVSRWPRRFRDMAQYRGQIVALNGDLYSVFKMTGDVSRADPTTAAVTGSGTAFRTEIRRGDWIVQAYDTSSASTGFFFRSVLFSWETQSQYTVGRVSTVASDTACTIEWPNTGAGGSFGVSDCFRLRPLSMRERNRIYFSGTAADVSAGIVEDRSNYAEWPTDAYIDVGDDGDGAAHRLLSIGDDRLLVFFDRAIWAASGTPPVGTQLSPDFRVWKIRGGVGISARLCADVDLSGQVAYFAGTQGIFRIAGDQVERIDDPIRQHPRFNPAFSTLKVAGQRVYIQQDEADPTIWIYDVDAGAWTWTTREGSDGDDMSDGGYAATRLDVDGDPGGIAVSPDRQTAYVFYRSAMDDEWKMRALNAGTRTAALSHGAKVQTRYTDGGIPGDKHVVQMGVQTAGALTSPGTLQIAAVYEGQAEVSRDVTPARTAADGELYRAFGSAGARGGVSVAVRIGDGITPVEEIRDAWAEVDIHEDIWR